MECRVTVCTVDWFPANLDTWCRHTFPNDTVHSTQIPHFPQNSEENFPHREFTSIFKVRFPWSFLNFFSTDILQTVRR